MTIILNLEDVVDQPHSAYWADQGAAYIQVLDAIEERQPCPSQKDWEAHWGSYSEPEAPKFLQRSNVFRWLGRFVTAPRDAELRFFTELKRRLFKEYLSDVTALAEFGCGTGHNLKQYGEMFPKVKLTGFDWSPSAVALVSKIPNAVGLPLDMGMRWPWREDLGHPAVLTCGSLEQLGDNFMPFLHSVVEMRPPICVHVEPCVELYDETKLFDRVAAMYHRSRGYLGRWIAEVEKLGEVLLKHRTGFGNIYNEGYSVVVWRPR